MTAGANLGTSRASQCVVVAVVSIGLWLAIAPQAVQAQRLPVADDPAPGAQTAPDPSGDFYNYIERLQQKRARENRERQDYIERTDALINSMRRDIFEIELTIKEIDFLEKNIECTTARRFEEQMAAKVANLRSWRDQMAGRCDQVDPLNEDAIAFCQGQIAGVDETIAHQENKVTLALAACQPGTGQNAAPAATTTPPKAE